MNAATELPAPVVSALTQGRKIEAIKLLREAHGIGLKEAKDTVEAYAQSRPEVGAKLDALNREGGTRVLQWTVALMALLIAAYWLKRLL
jgi:hypothetical protein